MESGSIGAGVPFDDDDDYIYEDRTLELHILTRTVQWAVQLVQDYASLALTAAEPPIYRQPNIRQLHKEYGGEYEFEASLQVERTREPGCIALSVRIARNGKGVLGYEAAVLGCKHEHYDVMDEFARALGGKLCRVDWATGTFTVEVYVLELAQRDCAKG